MENIVFNQAFDLAVFKHEQRHKRIEDVKDAINSGFKAEPDLAPHHLPLLSDDALERVFKESEKWRDKANERALERRVQTLIEADEKLKGHYLKIREIIGALDTPKSYYNHERNQHGHIEYTEHKARALVEKADASERNRKAAEIAEENLQWYVQRAEATTKLIEQYHCSGRFPQVVTDALLDALLGRPQCGEQTEGWTTWEWEYKPRDLKWDTAIEYLDADGAQCTGQASAIDWSDVRKYRAK